MSPTTYQKKKYMHFCYLINIYIYVLSKYYNQQTKTYKFTDFELFDEKRSWDYNEYALLLSYRQHLAIRKKKLSKLCNSFQRILKRIHVNSNKQILTIIKKKL